jgi:methylthioribose-1-phosphate isomerase
MRDGDEIKKKYFEKPTALNETKCLNPAFDVTDNSLITAIITDKGIAKAPFDKSLKELLK